MANYKSRIYGGYQLEQTHEAQSTESELDFTINSDDFSKTSHYVIVADLTVDGSLILQMQLNELTSSVYYEEGRRIAAGVETLLDINGALQFNVAHSTILSANNANATIIIHI